MFHLFIIMVMLSLMLLLVPEDVTELLQSHEKTLMGLLLMNKKFEMVSTPGEDAMEDC